MQLVKDGEGGASGRYGWVDKEATFEGENIAPGSVRIVGWGIGEAAIVMECVIKCSYCVCTFIGPSVLRYKAEDWLTLEVWRSFLS